MSFPSARADSFSAKRVPAREFKGHVITTEEQFGMTAEKAAQAADSADIIPPAAEL